MTNRHLFAFIMNKILIDNIFKLVMMLAIVIFYKCVYIHIFFIQIYVLL